LSRSVRSGKPIVQVMSVRKARCPGQVGQESQLSRSSRSGRPVVQVKSVRKANCSGQAGQEGQLFRSGRSGRPVVQVSSVRKANCSGQFGQECQLFRSRKPISTSQDFKRQKVDERIKKSTNWAESRSRKVKFGSCIFYEIVAGLVYKSVCSMDAAPAHGSNTESKTGSVSAITRLLRKQGY